MPRILPKPHHEHGPACQNTNQTVAVLPEASTDVQLKLLETKLVPKDLINNFKDATITETTYLYVDNNGVPGKILAVDIVPKSIGWDILADEVKQKILDGIAKQNKLIPGDHIVITEDNEIKLSLTATDLDAITKTEADQLISDRVVLKVDEVSDVLKQAILADLDQRLEVFNQDVDQKIYLGKQETVALVTTRVEAALGDIDTVVENKIETALSGVILDCGLIEE